MNIPPSHQRELDNLEKERAQGVNSRDAGQKGEQDDVQPCHQPCNVPGWQRKMSLGSLGCPVSSMHLIPYEQDQKQQPQNAVQGIELGHLAL